MPHTAGSVRLVELPSEVWGRLIHELTDLISLAEMATDGQRQADSVRALREEIISGTREIPFEQWLAVEPLIDDATVKTSALTVILHGVQSAQDDPSPHGPVIHGLFR